MRIVEHPPAEGPKEPRSPQPAEQPQPVEQREQKVESRESGDPRESCAAIYVAGPNGSGNGASFLAYKDEKGSTKRSLLITAAHVVQSGRGSEEGAERRYRASDVGVQFLEDQKTYRGLVVGASSDYDIAAILVEEAVPGKPLTIASAPLTEDEHVRAYAGNDAQEMQGSVLNTPVPDDERIITDVPVGRGASGGPLLNEAGEVVGVVSSMSPDGEARAVPADKVREFLEYVIAEDDRILTKNKNKPKEADFPMNAANDNEPDEGEQRYAA